MKAEKEHIDELIVSYLSNELDGNAVHELKEWIAASVENEKYFMQRQEIWFSAISVKEDVKYDKSKAFEQFKNRIANHEGGNLAASKIRNLECPSYEICLIDYGCGKFNRKIHIMEQYP